MLTIALAFNGALAGQPAHASAATHAAHAHADCPQHPQHGNPYPAAGKGCCGCFCLCDCQAAHAPAIAVAAPLLAGLAPSSLPTMRRPIDLPPIFPERLLRPPAV